MKFPWTSLMLTLALCSAQNSIECPSQDLILPCRCTTRNGEYQVWCSHSDLPRVLGGIRSIGQYIFKPIDELILENNYLPSLPGRVFLPLKVMRLMLRYNGLERVSNGWLTGLENSLLELFLVEPDLRSLPEDSLSHLVVLQAVTIQSNSLKRLPSFSNLPRLNYIQIESLALIEVSSRHFKNLPALEKIHVNGSPMLMRLEDGLIQDLPRLTLFNLTYSGISWLHPQALTRLPALRELSLVGNKITDPVVIGRAVRELPNLESLNLDFNVIERLSEAAFIDLPSLTRLSIANNQIKELHRGAFNRVPSLRILNLNNNIIQRVHPESFLRYSVGGLDELWLDNNDISHVAEVRSILEALPTLVFLDMSFNRLEVIPFAGLRGHPNLERLNFDFNKLHIIERGAFNAMPALRELTLKNNSLSEMLENPLWNLPSLKGLDISGNFFRRIEPGLLTNLPSLRRVDLSVNQIDYINPLSFLDTPALEYVNVSFNRLVMLHPSTFRHLLGLYEIDVSNNGLLQFIPGLPRGTEYLHAQKNRITTLPLPNSPDLDLPALKMLDVSHNNLRAFQRDSLRSLPLLKKLYLGNNFLQNLEEQALSGLGKLEVLDLQNNQLAYVHPKLINHMPELKELNLRNNKLNTIGSEVFQGNPNLKLLDISKNQIKEIAPGAFVNTRELELINASHNYIIRVPSSLNGMKNLRVLDVTNNRLNNIDPDLLTGLTSLAELRLTQNLLLQLPTATFDNLQFLKLLFLDKNEVETVETNAFRSLPALQHLKLNENELKDVPDFTFNDLPNLQVLELQENFIQRISNNAFHMVPHLLVLNLSRNLLQDMKDAGLQNLGSLEMLDVSFNRLIKVVDPNLEKMEWMVELKMDNNRICGVHGTTFNRMPRLRVLSMRNNNMMSFPERAVQKLRGNLAVLDIEGNPLTCGCNLLWLRAWLQESSTLGPRCLDGSLLRESRLSREECTQEHRLLEPVAPGCESELLSVPDSFDTSQIFITPWMKNFSTHMNLGTKNNLVPSPEESDYFYDEYVDYAYNDTMLETSNTLNGNYKPTTLKPKTQSSHFISGDTPTIYAASSKNKTKVKDIPKEISDSPSSSGFTFFGVPLPSLGFNFLGGGRKNNGKDKEEVESKTVNAKELPPIEGKSAIVNDPVIYHQQAERKSAVVNKPSRGVVSRGMYPFINPAVETGGFIPILPGTGGFKPITNPNLQKPVTAISIEKLNVTIIDASDSNTSPTTIPLITQPHIFNKSDFKNLGHLISTSTTKSDFKDLELPIPTPSATITTTAPSKQKIETKLSVQPTLEALANTKPLKNITNVVKINETKSNITSNLKPVELEQIKNISEFLSTTIPTLPKSSRTTTSKPELETVINAESFEDIFKDVIENVSIQPSTSLSNKTEILNTLDESNAFTAVNNKKGMLYQKSKNATMPALLIPGGQQPQFRTAGRPTITKIESTHASTSTDTPSTITTMTVENIIPLPRNNTKKPPLDTAVTRYVDKSDKSWYFANYNQTNLEPYIGEGYFRSCEMCLNMHVFVQVLAVFVHITFVVK